MRLSGAEAADIARQLVRLRGALDHAWEHARARLADVLDPDDSEERIDEALVTFFAAPNSYTAEDLVEIAAHGSPVVLDLLLRQGFRRVGPGTSAGMILYRKDHPAP